MNVLTLEDLLEVSMFRCKICNRRLQSPVLQVGMFGNICGGICYEKSAFTDVIPNVDVETLLAKLQVPCNYRERGCTYDGCYYKTCEHERDCEFRDKICPLTYLETCDGVTGNFHNIPNHILSDHQECVLNGAINCTIDVPNPTESNRDLFYLLNLDNKKFLLRTWIDSMGLCIFYSFYCFENGIDLGSVNVSFNMHWENRILSITDRIVNHVQPESAMRPMCDIDNAFRIPMTTLKSLDCLEKVNISININQKPIIESPRIQLNDSMRKFLMKCSTCSNRNYFMSFCIDCQKKACQPCTLIPCSVSQYHNWVTINFSKLGVVYDVFCQNLGCPFIIKSDEINRHDSICLFKKYECPYRSQAQCKWHDVIKNMADHINDTHPELVNRNNVSVETSKDIYFVRGALVFKQTFNLSSNGDFSITTTMLDEAAGNNSYKWEIRVKREDTPVMMIITDMCNKEGQQKTIKVTNYITNKKLAFYADIKLADKY